MHDEVAFGRCAAPERIAWAAHVRWAIEGDFLYILDLRRDAYLALPAARLGADPEALERRLRARGLLRSAEDGGAPLSSVAPRRGKAGFVSFWRAALWARGIMRRRALDRAADLLQGAEQGIDRHAEGLVDRFRTWRPLYPRAASCLFDSLALGRFLLSAGVRANLVYAVRGAPFAAHAWLESGGVIINDDPEYCAAFTPMRGP